MGRQVTTRRLPVADAPLSSSFFLSEATHVGPLSPRDTRLSLGFARRGTLCGPRAAGPGTRAETGYGFVPEPWSAASWVPCGSPSLLGHLQTFQQVRVGPARHHHCCRRLGRAFPDTQCPVSLLCHESAPSPTPYQAALQARTPVRSLVDSASSVSR